MKSILVLFILIVPMSFCSAQKSIKQKQNNSTKPFLKVLKIITNGNQDQYYNGKLFMLNDLLVDSVNLYDSDTLKKVFDELEYDRFELRNLIVRIRTPFYYYDYRIGKMKDFEKVDTILYVVNYDTLSIKRDEEELLVKQAELESLEKENLRRFEEIFIEIMNEAEEKVSYYRSKIDGKRRNYIADFLYDEGFSRDLTTSGSVLKEIYTLSFVYDDIPARDKSYKIVVALWNSYGYGKFFYSIDYEIYLLGK